MNFIEKIKDYIVNENLLNPYQQTSDVMKTDLDKFLQSNKGMHDEYSIEVFQEALKQHKDIVSAGEVIESMKRKNNDLKKDILKDLELLQGRKLKLAIDNTSYLISKEGEEINLGRAFE